MGPGIAPPGRSASLASLLFWSIFKNTVTALFCFTMSWSIFSYLASFWSVIWLRIGWHLVFYSVAPKSTHYRMKLYKCFCSQIIILGFSNRLLFQFFLFAILFKLILHFKILYSQNAEYKKGSILV